MSEVKHTPGPWLIAENSPTFVYALDSVGHNEFDLNVQGRGQFRERHIANARLIAAAPDLLEALKGVVAVADRKTDEFDRARAAIAKAEGAA